MTADEQGSARRSGRVESDDRNLPGQPPTDANKAPESMDNSALGSTRSEGRGRRVGRRQLDYLARDLSDRDRAILRSCDDYGLLRTTHLQQLHFHDHLSPEAAARICRRVLKRLSDHRLIEPIERRIGGIRAGSEGTVWRLGPAGDRLLRQGDSEAPRARRREPSLRFLEHRLLVADVACQLNLGARAGHFELLSVVPEPGSWRPYSGLHGSRDVLKPDLFAVTAAGEYEDSWFIEIDRGTESLPTVLAQCGRYEDYRRAGIEQQRLGIFPRVLWLVPDSRRREGLAAAIKAHRTLDPSLYRVHLLVDVRAVIRVGAS